MQGEGSLEYDSLLGLLRRTLTQSPFGKVRVVPEVTVKQDEPEQFDPTDAASVAAFAVRRLRDPSSEVRHAAIECLQRDFPTLQRQESDVAELLHDQESWFVRRAAISALARLPLDAPSAWRYFGAPLTADLSAEVRAAAARALAGLPAEHATQLRDLAWEDLVRATSDESWGVRATAVRALGNLATANGIDPIARTLADEAAAVRVAALEALAALQPTTDVLAPHAGRLATLGDDAQPEVQLAAQALARVMGSIDAERGVGRV